MIFKLIIGIVVILVAYHFLKVGITYKKYLQYKKQGLVFNDKDGFSAGRDMALFREHQRSCPTSIVSWTNMLKSFCGEEVPPLVGL
jgi:hypothetical protein